MTHDTVFRKFTMKFPDYVKNTSIWFPNGKDSIHIRLVNGKEFVFTIKGRDDWCFETVNSFVKRLKGEINNGRN